MSEQAPIRLLIADELPYSHGVENVSVALVKEFLNLVEEVTWVTGRPSRSNELKQRFPNANNLRFASLFKEEPSANANNKTISSIGWKGILKRLPIIGRGARRAHRNRIDARLRRICQKNLCSHCFVNYALSQTPPKLEIPVVGLVHDLNFLHFPDNFTPEAPEKLRRSILNWLEEADAVTVLSGAGKNEILSLSNRKPKARVEIIPNAITPSDSQGAIKKRTDKPPMLLYPATALAHKNHLGLLQATRKLALDGIRFHVIMTGSRIEEIGGDEPVDNATVETARKYYIEHQEVLSKMVSFRTARDSDELAQLYRKAHRVILPTKYEGFGLPLLEAISHGTRVLCSTIPQFREQVDRYHCQSWVKFFDGNDPNSIAGSIKEALIEPENPLAIPEVENKLAKWQWKDSALSYLTLFEELETAFTNRLVAT